MDHIQIQINGIYCCVVALSLSFKFGDFMLLFDRIRQRNLLNCVLHAQHIQPIISLFSGVVVAVADIVLVLCW